MSSKANVHLVGQPQCKFLEPMLTSGIGAGRCFFSASVISTGRTSTITCCKCISTCAPGSLHEALRDGRQLFFEESLAVLPLRQAFGHMMLSGRASLSASWELRASGV